VALSQDEQRILDEMERNLAADDPRLAARLGSFGQPRLPSQLKIQHARTIGGILALALIATVTVMVFVISPFANHIRDQQGPRGAPSTAARATQPARATTAGSGNSAPAKTARAAAGAKTAKASAGTKTATASAATKSAKASASNKAAKASAPNKAGKAAAGTKASKPSGGP
jgi:hypothetical protein